jgi:hypothetical protein
MTKATFFPETAVILQLVITDVIRNPEVGGGQLVAHGS